MIERKRFSKILAKADPQTVHKMAERLKKKRSVVIVKEPCKTLAMIRMREPVQNSRFYLGEVIVSEAVVEVDSARGMAAIMGDDFNRVLDMAILDACRNGGFFTEEETLLQLELQQEEKEEKENAMFLKTMVNFHSMDSEAAQ